MAVDAGCATATGGAMSTLMLRDIQQPPAPAWWPPAPGWWWLAAALLTASLVVYAWRRHHARRRARIEAAFDGPVDAASTPAAQLAAMSALLRRAARQQLGVAATLEGEAWLQALDTPRHRRGRAAPMASASFLDGPGRLLLDGPFRRDVAPEDVAAVRALARARFMDWMGVR